MKRHDLFLAIALILVGGFITVLVANQRMDILPKPEVEGGERGMLGIDKNINEETIDNYLGRKDAVYRDMRMFKDPGNYEAIGGDSYLSGFVKGFEVKVYLKQLEIVIKVKHYSQKLKMENM